MSLLTITLGDPFSINAKAVEHLLDQERHRGLKILLIGSEPQFLYQTRRTLESFQATRITDIQEISRKHNGVYFLNIDNSTVAQCPRSLDKKERGRLSAKALDALSNFEENEKLAVLTCPIDKSAAKDSGFKHPGQTEFFSKIWGNEALMVLSGPKLRVGLVTNHLPIRDVSASLSVSLIAKKIEVFSKFLRGLGIDSPRIAVCGLNPHASDNGLFGDEEGDFILPAIDIALSKDNSLTIDGPKSADTVFFESYNGKYDGVLSMYHDQGLGPLKTVHFYDAVNISAGLKHLRVSPDHGPAQDLYGTSKANLASFEEAYRICLKYLNHSSQQ